MLTKSEGPGGIGNLISQYVEQLDCGYCFSFYYYMHGTAPPFLKVYSVTGKCHYALLVIVNDCTLVLLRM